SARTMEIYAAMVERLDYHVGRLIGYLKDSGLYDDTVIVFMSDNGAEGNDRMRLLDNETWVPANHDLSYANMGRLDSYVFPGPAWAQVSSAPLRLFKAYVTDGGLRVPVIVNFEGNPNAGSFNTAVATIQDLAPTFLELAETEQPGTIYAGRTVRPMTGRSLLPLLTGRVDSIYGPDEALGWELFGHRALRRGDWKLLWADGKNGSDTWQLYDIASDPREVVDLAASEPERLEAMIALWEAYAASNNVILPIGDIGSPN
ncbi:MAG: sulfatase-like hydrolase/transferase, partial [Gammaproteobacteria bacterium]